MGYTTRKGHLGHNITEYWPDDDENTTYIACCFMSGQSGYNLTELIDIIKQKWPNNSLSDFSITCEYVHTDCIGYDMYDAGDWTKFIKIHRQT